MKPADLLLLLWAAAWPQTASAADAGLISSPRQLTFAGERAGEGYFDKSGRLLIFQSEREPENPFFQIYLMDLADGSSRRLSSGVGRTTCSWIHPDGKRALFSSTHEDPGALEKQKSEYERRQKEGAGRHKWDYDEFFDIYEVGLESGKLRNLTRTRGYDAEGSYSPDGGKILFASNRHAYVGGLSAQQQERFRQDPGVALDLYLMSADGSGPERLTRAWGGDGGPFFAPDGKSIVWRRFEPDGRRAEIFSMRLEDKAEIQITRLGAMSWAPFFHPSGRYVIFATNLHGMDNFELYLVDAAGEHEPVRVTDLPGFDGLPVFSPDGARLVWTSNRTVNGKGQLFLADWNHARALSLLGLGEGSAAPEPPARTPAQASTAGIEKDIRALAAPGLEGRLCGGPGERRASSYIAGRMKEIGLRPAGENGYFQSFPFVKGVELGRTNRLSVSAASKKRTAQLKRDWLPLGFSRRGKSDSVGLVFAGWGMVAPPEKGADGYDAFQDVDVRGCWVMVFRDLPPGLSQEERLRLSPFSDLRRKVAEAKARGAAGMLLVSAPGGGFKQELVELSTEGSAQDAGIFSLSLSDALAEEILRPCGKTLAQLEKEYSGPRPPSGFVCPDASIQAEVDLRLIWGQGRNVLGRLTAGAEPGPEPILVGAHLDHIGRGEGMGSLARPEERGQVHPGADDNASGVAVVLEVAVRLAAAKKQGRWKARRDVIFAAWSGEEMGLLGSEHFAKKVFQPPAAENLKPSAYLNLDMVGRLRENLILYGLETSTAWAALVERAAVPTNLSVAVQKESLLPTDTTSFVVRGVPSLSAFTGLHDEYNTPRDKPDAINFAGCARVADLFERLVTELAGEKQPPAFSKPPEKATQEESGRHGMRASLGTVPDFSAIDVKGVKLSGVRPGSPAEKAGIKAGDVVVELAGVRIENLYDYARAIGALEVGKPARLAVERAGRQMEFDVVPESRK